MQPRLLALALAALALVVLAAAVTSGHVYDGLAPHPGSEPSGEARRDRADPTPPVSVDAPGTRVRAGDDRIRIEAPHVDIDIGLGKSEPRR
ncbi:MAG: hypothetical protein SFW09_12945 [Hyphomicrobiaceae bacterium]|nr:hypothetical protein [Hyphomicrobiaceae bacterium]